MSLIECVPNVSEGRRADVVESLAGALRSTAGVALLDASSDVSHHRSVFTFVGDAVAVSAGVMALAAHAIDRIDLGQHQGAHPRIGALDVVPFVPLGPTSMAACVDLARSVGAALAERFALPVFLYEEAAQRPERRRLEDIRRGGFEALAEKLAQPEWAPDFGPPRPHPTAGATVVGARPFLIAFNIYLATPHVEVARAVAASLRERDGGLPSVKALGLLADGRAQVSINLTDFTKTSLQTVVDRVVELAKIRGVDADESELIGLLPAAALAGTTPGRLRLRDFTAHRIVEERLKQLHPR